MAFIASIFRSISFAKAIWQRVRVRLCFSYLILEILVTDDIVVEEARSQLAGERKAAQTSVSTSVSVSVDAVF